MVVKKSNKKRPTKEELQELYINQNKTAQEIGDIYGIDKGLVKYYLHTYDIRKYKNKITMDDIKAEADKIANEMLASRGIEHNEQVTNQVSEQVTNQVSEQVDSFMEELKEEVYDTDIPLDWQPTVNVLTRMYESGENTYEFVKFYKSKGIIVKLPKKKYNKDIELQKIKFNINSSSFYYDVNETDEYFTISITLV